MRGILTLIPFLLVSCHISLCFGSRIEVLDKNFKLSPPNQILSTVASFDTLGIRSTDSNENSFLFSFFVGIKNTYLNLSKDIFKFSNIIESTTEFKFDLLARGPPFIY